MNFSKLKKKRGFTLVEILIVMMIIGVLSSLAVNGYMSYRRSALLELSADNIVAQIFELRDDAIHGDIGSKRLSDIKGYFEEGEELPDLENGGAKCFGLYFEKVQSEEGEIFEVSAFEQKFEGKKVFNAEYDVWEYQGCTGFVIFERASDIVLTPLELDEVVIEEIALIGDVERNIGDKFVIRFFPPNGGLEVADGALDNFSDKFDENEGVRIRIRYGVSDEDRYKRDIILNFSSLNTSVNRI